MVYATPDVAPAVSSGLRSFRPGAVLAKEKLSHNGSGSPEGVAFMVKHSGREFNATGGWEFRYYPLAGDPKKTHQHCAGCHRNGLSRDYVLGEYPPR